MPRRIHVIETMQYPVQISKGELLHQVCGSLYGRAQLHGRHFPFWQVLSSYSQPFTSCNVDYTPRRERCPLARCSEHATQMLDFL
jgi:hypothetical protein